MKFTELLTIDFNIMSRNSKTQSQHDQEVSRIAKGLEKRGFNVAADIAGYQKPDTIRGFRPDVFATKGKEKKIVEVETPDSVDSARDQKQQAAFRARAKASLNTTFRRVVTKG